MVALSNPKSIAFFTAFLRSSVDPSLPVGRQLARNVCCFRRTGRSPDFLLGYPAGLGGPGSYSRGGQSCSADCPV